MSVGDLGKCSQLAWVSVSSLDSGGSGYMPRYKPCYTLPAGSHHRPLYCGGSRKKKTQKNVVPSPLVWVTLGLSEY
ncbi:hypothetical protein NP493_182g03017 [Ridgeia piscesae]|uniref:Uncharacterized protein n=1 Tax=Ridgeia piscesae TaxID=27915 RepID=A0AAD9P2G6_RIDPI|nr:hypothetical protein NP493_182g03017 [Ridgeia piscesae]